MFAVSLSCLIFRPYNAGGAETGGQNGYDSHFLSPEEQESFNQRRQNAATAQERNRITQEEQARAQERAEQMLLTNEERERFRQQLQDAHTNEERSQIRQEQQSLIRERAQQHGLKWPGATQQVPGTTPGSTQPNSSQRKGQGGSPPTLKKKGKGGH